MSHPIPIRMSSAGKCPRMQYYAAIGTPESNPPDRQSENRMALGDAAETILINNMIADGWEIVDTRAVEGGEQIELEISWPLPMTGHPDGICRHQHHTNGKWVTLECKSMSTPRLQEVRQHGIAKIYPEYLAQTTCYSRVLYEQKQVVHPHRAVFAYMDRDGENPAPEKSCLERRLRNSPVGAAQPNLDNDPTRKATRKALRPRRQPLRVLPVLHTMPRTGSAH